MLHAFTPIPYGGVCWHFYSPYLDLGVKIADKHTSTQGCTRGSMARALAMCSCEQRNDMTSRLFGIFVFLLLDVLRNVGTGKSNLRSQTSESLMGASLGTSDMGCIKFNNAGNPDFCLGPKISGSKFTRRSTADLSCRLVSNGFSDLNDQKYIKYL